MIQVTLNFPDQAALVQFFTSVSAPAPVAVKPGIALESGEFIPAQEIKAPKAAAGGAASETKKADASSKTAAAKDTVAADPKPEPEATTSSAKPSASVDYPTLQKAVFALAGKSRESAAAVAASMGVKTFKELPEARWAEALAAVNAALGA